MAVIVPRLTWSRGWRVPVSTLAVLAITIALAAGLLRWRHSLAEQLGQRQQQLARATTLLARMGQRPVPAVAALSPEAARQIRDQQRLLRRDWGRLSSQLLPPDREVKLLELDVNPTTSAIRILGVAPTMAAANAYAETLSRREGVMQRVRLQGVKREPEGIRFEVSGQWNP